MDDGKQNTNSTVSSLASDLSAKRSLNSDILYAAESRFEGLELSISNLFRGFGEASSLLQM